MKPLVVLSIRQIDGVRYIAVTRADARAVHVDRTMIDCVSPVGCYDTADRRWGRAGDDTREGREAIRAHLTSLAAS